MAYIQGVQSQGVGACVKHFAATTRNLSACSISSEVGERALREIYLPPFKAAVQEGERLDGDERLQQDQRRHTARQSLMLTEILRDEWGFEGFVVSDWSGTNSTVEAANAGLDLEMPGPARYMGERLLQAVQDGEVSEAAIDDKVRRLLRLMLKCERHGEAGSAGAGHRPARAPRADPRGGGRGDRAAQERGRPAAAGRREPQLHRRHRPQAPEARIMGGGSAQVNAHYVVSPLEGIRTALWRQRRDQFCPRAAPITNRRRSSIRHG